MMTNASTEGRRSGNGGIAGFYARPAGSFARVGPFASFVRFASGWALAASTRRLSLLGSHRWASAGMIVALARRVGG